jgi:hypothetical protein
MSNFLDHIKAGFPALWLHTQEKRRITMPVFIFKMSRKSMKKIRNSIPKVFNIDSEEMQYLSDEATIMVCLQQVVHKAYPHYQITEYVLFKIVE